jgi:hypothetical protein
MAEPSEQRNGVAIVANDRIVDWLLPFLESYAATNRETALFLIPYDENMTRTRKAAQVYGATIVEDAIPELDALARRLYPLSPYRRRRLRKLQALALPLDRVIYLDVDIILFRELLPLFACVRPGEADFIVASASEDYVYNSRHADYSFLKDVRLFSDGFFLTSRHVLGLRDFEDVIECEEKLFHSVRKRGGLYAQPLVNFVVHSRRLQVRSLSECLPDASDESFYKVRSASFREDGPADLHGRAIYFVHWAGAVRKPSSGFFDAAWLAYARDAAVRMAL